MFEVYQDDFREFLKQELDGRRFDWILDVDPDAPGDTISAIVRPAPMPIPARRGHMDAPALTLEEALEAVKRAEFYRVIRTSDPL